MTDGAVSIPANNRMLIFVDTKPHQLYFWQFRL